MRVVNNRVVEKLLMSYCVIMFVVSCIRMLWMLDLFSHSQTTDDDLFTWSYVSVTEIYVEM